MFSLRLLEHNPIPMHPGLTVAAAEREVEMQAGGIPFDLAGTPEATAEGDWFMWHADVLQALRRGGGY